MSIHFSEIILILLVALIVIQPHRLPEVAMALGRFIKWSRQIILKIKKEITYDQ